MRKSVLFFGVATAVAGVLAFSNIYPHSTGAPAGRYSGCGGDGCHMGELGTGSLTINVTDTNDKEVTDYMPGKTYLVRITVTDSEARRFGFETAALAGGISGRPAGKFSAGNSSLVQFADGDPNYVTHTLSGTLTKKTGANSWTFMWTAPKTDIGDITVYAAGNGANGDSTPFGDHIYSTDYILKSPGTGIGHTGISRHFLELYPNPVNDFTTFHYQAASKSVARLSVFNLEGTILSDFEIPENGAGINGYEFDARSLAAGVYLLKITSGNQVYYTKLMKI